MKKIISIVEGVTKNPVWRMAEPVNFEMLEGEHIAVTGPNGGGKTMFTDILIGKHPLLNEPLYDFSPNQSQMVNDNVKCISFRDTYGGETDRTYFLQQRWNSTEINPDTPTVNELLEREYRLAGPDTPERQKQKQRLFDLFDLYSQLDKYVILLSSGELRKLQLVRALLSSPRIIILDNPFIGLDVATKNLLKALLQRLANEKVLQMILVLSRNEEIPDFITHVVCVRDMTVSRKMKRDEFLLNRSCHVSQKYFDKKKFYDIVERTPQHGDFGDSVIEMNNICIRYGIHTILKNLNWKVEKGEHWSLLGPNGSGKSTLLSIVCADNPQSYACDISLFGKQRGSGESIWDIKKRIGYVSPEMHRAYNNRDLSAIRIVASGFKDSIGLYSKPSEEEFEQSKKWMDVFHLHNIYDRSFLKLSSGEQRMILLARAFVKNPDLLILDEPFHGLDDSNRSLAGEIIEAFCEQKNKTMIMVTHYNEDLPKCINKSLKLQTL